ncbi:MAG: hypothetical protein Q8P10_01355 [bacterium]|nr:hypothetical protein [bacterium]
MTTKFKVLLLIIVVAALGTLGMFLVGNTKNISQNPKITQQTSKPAGPTTIPTSAPAPTTEPLTQASADSELNNIDTQLNDGLTQMNIDLNSVDQIDSSQDNITL